MGRENYIAERAVLGGRPQHTETGSEQGVLTLGDNNTIRECATLHRGLNSGDVTQIGNHCLLMVNCHVGHDCVVGSHVIIANNVMLAGHVQIGDSAYLSGAVAVHQFCRVGRNAMVGGLARLVKDAPPFFTVDGGTTSVVGLNRIGLRRSGFRRDEVAQIKAAYRLIYRCGLDWAEILESLRREFPAGPVAELLEFLRTSERGIVQERRANPKERDDRDDRDNAAPHRLPMTTPLRRAS